MFIKAMKNLLMVQFFPSKPGKQAQVQLFTPSTHAPLFSHGLGQHSLISDRKPRCTILLKQSRWPMNNNIHLINKIELTYFLMVSFFKKKKKYFLLKRLHWEVASFKLNSFKHTIYNFTIAPTCVQKSLIKAVEERYNFKKKRKGKKLLFYKQYELS